MNLYKYTVKLLDPLFYSLEGLSGCFPPYYLHSTAINCAFAYASNISDNIQPYIISESNGGRNIPRYENSLISNDFYFSPASPVNEPNYFTENVKGDYDKYLVKSKQGEVLRISFLHFIPPETIFEGYCFLKDNTEKLDLIRLGSFRGKARLRFDEIKYIKKETNRKVVHPVDPLVSEVNKGVMINILPYPIIINSVCKNVIKIKEQKSGYFKYISLPLKFEIRTDNDLSYDGTVIF